MLDKQSWLGYDRSNKQLTSNHVRGESMNTTNNKAYIAVQNRLEFKASNTYAISDENTYKVYSYGPHFPIYVAKEDINGQVIWYENKDKYSVTTSKQKTQLRPRNVINFIALNTQEMINL